MLLCATDLYAQTLHHDVYTIGMKRESGGARYPFVCIEGAPYFYGGRKQTTEDRPTRWPWKTFKECAYFELSLRGNDVSTTIRNLGPGGFNEGATQFVMKTVKGDEKSLPGYLTADYSTDPPSVKLEKAPGKTSNWVLHAKGEGKYYIENISESGKHAWLTKDSKPAAVLEYDGKSVVEYDRAALSYDSKLVFVIRAEIDESDK